MLNKQQLCARLVVTFGCLFVLAACANNNYRERDAEKKSVAVIEGYFATLNRRDLLALTLYVAPDVEWYSEVDGERILEVSGSEALITMLTRYFSQHQSARWTVLHTEQAEPFVAVIERSQWSEDDRMQSRTGLGVYEIENGRIRRMTYFLSNH